MKTFKLPSHKTKSVDHPLKCTIIFLLIAKTLIIFPLVIPFGFLSLKFLYLLGTGWFTWTFFEYMLHRFLWHNKNEHNRKSDDIFNHAYHHTHPAEIRMTNTRRLIYVAVTISLIVVSIWLHNYFTLVAGFVWGFTFYNFMHLLLHVKSTQKLLPRLVRYHIYHHCKYPDKCFGISVTWWDDLFGSIPHQSKTISAKIVDFYFGDKHVHSDSKNVHLLEATKKIIAFLIITLSFHFTSVAQDKLLTYDVIKNGTIIGKNTIVQKVNNNKTYLELTSDVKTRYIISISIYVNEIATFENGVMTNSYYYQKQNGDETRKQTMPDGNYYKFVSNGNIDSQNYFPVYYNYIQVFFEQPEATTKVYSNHYQQFLTMEKLSENRYRIELPDGTYNYYTYKGGICTQVDIKHTLFTLHFVLRKTNL